MKLALTKQDITAVICIDSYNIYLCVFATPPAADTVKQKRQLSLRSAFGNAQPSAGLRAIRRCSTASLRAEEMI